MKPFYRRYLQKPFGWISCIMFAVLLIIPSETYAQSNGNPPEAVDFEVNVRNTGESFIYPILEIVPGDDPVDPQSIEIITEPELAIFDVSNVGGIRYEILDPTSETSDIITYRVRDSEGRVSNEAVITVNLIDADTFSDITQFYLVGTGITQQIDLNSLLFYGLEEGGLKSESFTILDSTDPDGIESLENGILTFNSPDSFEEDFYFVRVQFIAESVDGTFSAPVLLDFEYTDFLNNTVSVQQGSETTVNIVEHLDEIIDDDFPVEFDTIEFASSPQNGTAEFADDDDRSVILYTPAEENDGTDEIIFRAFDSETGSLALKFRIDLVIEENPAPFFTNTFDDAEIQTGESFNFQFEAEDPNELPLEFSLEKIGHSLDVSFTSDGLFSITPDISDEGEFEFRVTVENSEGESVAHTFFLLIEAPEGDPPITNDVTATVANTGTSSIFVLLNDESGSDPIDPESIEIVIEPELAALGLFNYGEIRYELTEPTNETNDVFTYTIRDTEGRQSNEAVVSIEIMESSPISIFPIFYIYEEEESVQLELSRFVSHPDELLTDSFIFLENSDPEGTVNINENVLNYQRSEGVEDFVFQIIAQNQDGIFTRPAPGNLIHFEGVNTLFTAQPGVQKEMNVTGHFAALEDFEIDIDNYEVTLINQPEHGTLEQSNESQNIFLYTAEDGASGNDRFRVELINPDSGLPEVLVRVDLDITSDLAPLFTSVIDEETILVGDEFSFQFEAEDPQDEPLFFDLIVGNEVSNVDLTEDGIFSFTPETGQEGEYGFTIQVSNGTFINSHSFIINVSEMLPPVFTSVLQDTAITEEDELEFQFEAENPNDGELTFSLDEGGDVSNASITENGLFTFTPQIGQAGEYAFTVEVSDGELSDSHQFTIEVLELNLPPEFTSVPDETTITEGDEFSFQFEAVDPNDDELTFSLNESDDVENASITFDGLFAFNPEPGQAGSYDFTVRVSDGELFDEHEFVVIVEASNQPPVFESDPATIAQVGDLYEYNVVVSDPDGDDITLTAPTIPDWLDFTDNGDGTGLLSGIPEESDAGDNEVMLQANDGEDIATQEFTIDVREEPNEPPLFTTTFDEEAITEGDEFSFQFEAEDPDDDELTFSLSDGSNADNASISEDGLFTFTPQIGQAGEYAFTVVVSDGELSDSHSFTIEVLELNLPPVFTSVPDDATITEEDEFEFQFEAENPNDGELTFSLEEGSDVDNASITEDGLFSFTPQIGQAGEYVFTVVVSDGELSDSHSFTIDVLELNLPPFFTATLPDTSLTELETLEFQFEADDPNDDELTYFLSEGEGTDNVSVSGNGLFRFAPERGQAGEYDFIMTVSDGELTDEHSFTIRVEQANQPPVADDITVTTQINTPFTIDLLNFAADPDGGPLEVTEITTPSNGSITRNGSEITYMPDENFTGSDTFSYTVQDDESETDSGNISVEVKSLAFSVMDLGTPGSSFSRAFGISDAGHVTGISGDGSGNASGFLWYDGNLQTISGLSQAFSVNNDGAVAGIAEVNGVILPAIFTGGEVQIGETQGGEFAALYSINNSGLAAGTADVSGPKLAGFTWNLTEKDLFEFEDGDVQFFGINDQGVKAGYVQLPDGTDQAVLVRHQGDFQFLTHSGADGSRAMGVGNNGQAAGVLFNGSEVQAALWSSSGEALPLESLGGSFSIAYSINNSGVTVGSSGSSNQKLNLSDVELLSGVSSGASLQLGRAKALQTHSTGEFAKLASEQNLQAVIWQETGNLFNLNELIPADSGWELMEARAINNDLYIAGYGNFEGETRAFLLIPEDSGLPIVETVNEALNPGESLTADVSQWISGVYGSIRLKEVSGAKNGSAEIVSGYEIRYTAGNTAATDTLHYQVVDGRGAIAHGKFIIDTNELAESIELHQNYPNPFNPTTMIRYELPENSHVQLEVFDMTGRRVAKLLNEEISAGSHEVIFDASNLASGIYLYRLISGQTVLSRRLTLIK